MRSAQCVVGRKELTYRLKGDHKICSNSLVSELKNCGSKKDLERGKEVHKDAIRTGFDSSIYVGNALISMYAKCSNMECAHQVFDRIKSPDVVTWNTLISGYAENGKGDIGLDLFTSMQFRGWEPNRITLLAVLKACGALLEQDEGRKAECMRLGNYIQSAIERNPDIFVQNSLINMYSKCGYVKDAHQVFDSITYPDVVSWTTIILGYADQGQGSTALELFARMKSKGYIPSRITYVAALKACTCLSVNGEDGKSECLRRANEIISEIGGHSDIYVYNTLIVLYGKCGLIMEARQVFESIKNPTVASWNTLVLGYAENGEAATALCLFTEMKSQGFTPSRVTFLAAIKSCAFLASQDGARLYECLQQGRKIHSEITCHLDIYLQTSLVDMYSKCRSMADARQVFISIKKPNVVSWNALIMGYAENGDGGFALKLFARMKAEGYVPDSITFVAALKACTSLVVDQARDKAECLEIGKKLHAEIPVWDVYLYSTLIDMYSKCGHIADAHQVFNNIKSPDAVCWNALILGYVDNGDGHSALDIFGRMKSQGCPRNSVSYVAAIKACSLLGDLQTGRKLHESIDIDIRRCPNLVTTLVDFYAKCGSLGDAQDIFDSYPKTVDLTTWTALLSGYSRVGDTTSVFRLFEAMKDAGCHPNAVTYLCILTCCSHAGLVEKAVEFFETMSRNGVPATLEHYNCMVDILSRSNKLDDAVALVRNMPLRSNSVTWMTVFGACCERKNLEIGRLAFASLVTLENNATAYVLMSRIYESEGMWEEQQLILRAKAKIETSQMQCEHS